MDTKPTDTKPGKPLEKPAEAEPKQRPVKRPPKPAYHVPLGIAWLDPDDEKVTIRVMAGIDVDEGIIPDALIPDYLKRGAIVPLTNN